MNSINPFEYVEDVLDKIVDHPHNKIKELTPIEWKKLHLEKIPVNMG